jgi:hypothetical protein
MSAKHGLIANPNRTRDAAKSSHDDRASENDIVRDLAKIIDLGTLAEDRVLEYAAVDAGIRADSDMILQDHPAKVRGITLTIGRRHNAKTIFADPRAGQQSDVIAEKRTEDTCICTDLTMPTDLDTWPDRRIRTDPAAFTDNSAWSYNGPRRHSGRLMYLRIGRNAGVTWTGLVTPALRPMRRYMRRPECRRGPL